MFLFHFNILKIWGQKLIFKKKQQTCGVLKIKKKKLIGALSIQVKHIISLTLPHQ